MIMLFLNGSLSATSAIMYFIVIVLGFAYHEFAHAIAADRLGDPTPRSYGRISLNPLRHLDAFGLIMVAVIGFGWAVTPVNPRNLRGNWRQSMAIVAAAGPFANFLMAVMFGLLMRLILWLVFNNVLPFGTVSEILFELCHWGVYGNVLLMVFNLLPIPPLDGFTILLGLLPADLAIQLEPLRRYGSMAIIVVIFLLPRIVPQLDVIDVLVYPAINALYPILTGIPF